MHTPFKSQLELGAHAVCATNEDRLFVALGHFKQSTKSANTGHNALAQGFLGERFNAFNQGVAGFNINASRFVGQWGLAHGVLLWLVRVLGKITRLYQMLTEVSCAAAHNVSILQIRYCMNVRPVLVYKHRRSVFKNEPVTCQ